MDNAANIAYAALPERLYVVKDNNIIYEVRRREAAKKVLFLVATKRGAGGLNGCANMEKRTFFEEKSSYGH